MSSSNRYLAIVSLFACGTSGSETSTLGATPPQNPTIPTSPPPPPPPPPPSACRTDGECNFADPCQPDRCVASPAGAACGRPTTPGGSCVCFEGRCAMRPSAPRISQQSCKNTVDCDVDLASAQCEPGIAPDDEYRMRFSGPTCVCLPSDQRCHLHWFDPIPCRSDDDCWFEEDPVLHAIPRPRRLKGRKFRPCVDGARVPACMDGQCTIRAPAC
jgi:hypothetical protein